MHVNSTQEHVKGTQEQLLDTNRKAYDHGGAKPIIDTALLLKNNG